MNNLLALYNFIEENWVAERNIATNNLNHFDKLCFELYSFIAKTWVAERNIPFSVPECISECHSKCFPNSNNIDIPSYTSYLYLLPLALGSYIFVYIFCAFSRVDPTNLDYMEQDPGTILYLDTSNPILPEPWAIAERTFFRLIDKWDTYEGFVFHYYNIEFNILDWFNISYVRFTASQELINAAGNYFNEHCIYMTIYPFFSETALMFSYDFFTYIFGLSMFM